MTPEFLNYVQTHGINRIYIAGIDTDNCVLKCAVDLFEAGFVPVILADCCMSHAGIEAHQAALKILPRFIGPAQIIPNAFTHFNLAEPT
jgi:nicotinamidase-related amidase